MKRRIQGLRETTQTSSDGVPDGVFLVRVDRAQYRWHPAKPFYTLRLSVLEPRELAGRVISGRVYCTAKALWKLGWFLRDFLYDPDLLGREEIDERALSGLRGVVKISYSTINGTSLLNFDGFAPASQWSELSSASSLRRCSRNTPASAACAGADSGFSAAGADAASGSRNLPGVGTSFGSAFLTASRSVIHPPLAPGTAPSTRTRPRSTSVITTLRLSVVTRSTPM